MIYVYYFTYIFGSKFCFFIIMMFIIIIPSTDLVPKPPIEVEASASVRPRGLDEETAVPGGTVYPGNVPASGTSTCLSRA